MSALFDDAGGDRYVATEHSRGPWDPRHCHGGPVAALIARAVERCESGGETTWQVARITVELTRPVPVARPLQLATEIERPGGRVSLVAVRVLDGDVEVARARSLRIRATPVEVVATPPDVERLEPAPEHGRLEVLGFGRDEVSFARDACEHRVLEGTTTDVGPTTLWMRLRVPVVDDESPSGVQSAAATADFGNGISRGVDFDDFLFINPDLTVHLLRPPVGPWIGMRSTSHYGDAGAGLAESRLYDADGLVGRSVQSLFVDRR